MKILIVHPKLSWRGAERISVNLALELKKRGHEVSYLTLFKEELLPPGSGQLDLITPSKWLQRILFLGNLEFLMFGFWVLLYYVAKNSKKYDLINVHNTPASWAGVIVGKLMGKPVVWTVFSIPKDISWGKKANFFEYLSWLIASSFIDKLLVRYIDALIVPSRQTALELKRRYGKKAVVILPPVTGLISDTTRRQKKFPNWISKKFVFICAAHMHYKKNQAVLLKALSLIKNRLSDCQLILVGDGPDKEKLIRLTQKLSLTDRVVFTGLLRYDMLTKLYTVCDVLLLASIEEPLGLTPFEAIIRGVFPIVSSKSGAAFYIKKEKIGYVAQPNPEDFADKMLNAYKNRKEVEEMINRGRLWVKTNMTTELYVLKHEIIFKSLLIK